MGDRQIGEQLQRFLFHKITDVPAAEFMKFANLPLEIYTEVSRKITVDIGNKFKKEDILPGIFQGQLRPAEPRYEDQIQGIVITRSKFALPPGRTVQPPIEFAANPEARRHRDYQHAVSFVKAHPVFIFSYEIPGIVRSVQHAILFKKSKESPNILEYIDSNGTSWGVSASQMYKPYHDAIIDLFSDAGITAIKRLPCARTAVQKGQTCFLWATLFAVFLDKTQEEVLGMIDELLTKKGLPINPRTREAVVLVLFSEFIKMRGFVYPAIIPDWEQILEHRKGLGKKRCRKCGLLKQD